MNEEMQFLAMTRLILVAFLISHPMMGQTLDQSDLVAVVRLAFDEGKLPVELVVKVDSSFYRDLPNPIIVIKSNEKMQITRQYGETDDNVMIWDGEDIFLYNVSYWISLLESTKKKA